jgi:hypothetical protein
MAVVPDELQAEQADGVSTNGAVQNSSETLVNGTPLNGLEARIAAELERRGKAMRLRAAYGDELYSILREIRGAYSKIDSKNIPAAARAGLQKATDLLEKIDTETGVSDS